MNKIKQAGCPYRLRAVMSFARLLGVPIAVHTEWFMLQAERAVSGKLSPRYEPSALSSAGFTGVAGEKSRN